MPLRAHVEQVHEEIIGQCFGPLGENTVFGLPDSGIQGTHARVCKRFNSSVQAYCMMDKHYHLLVQTPDANLSVGMRQLNGVYTQLANRRHGRVGHAFQGRFKAILVDEDTLPAGTGALCGA